MVSCIPGWARKKAEALWGRLAISKCIPNALNTIAGKVEWVLDCRSTEKEKIDQWLPR